MIIELADNVVEPLILPDCTPIFVIIFLTTGFPIAIILSWIFDMTPKGVEKTKPLAEGKEAEKSVSPNGWMIATYVSIAVITGLIVLNFVGGNKQLRAGEFSSLVILPFDNCTGDDDLEYFVSGMHSSLIGDIGKISGLLVISTSSSNVCRNVDMSLPQIALTADEKSLLAETHTVDKEAYDAFLRGHNYWGGDLSEESLSKALEYLNIAI